MEKDRKTESAITIVDLWHLCVARWRWFTVSLCVCVLMAVNYLITTPYLYTSSAAIMVYEESLGKNTTESNVNEFSEIGFVNQKNNVFNVVRRIKSLNVMMEVVRRLQIAETEGEIVDKANAIQSRFTAEREDLFSTIINLTYKDYSTVEAHRVLSLIIEVYNDLFFQEKRLVTQNTSQFIDSRLALLERDLDRVDDSISTYKSRYGITDLQHVSDIYLQRQTQSDIEMLNLTNQKAMAEYIRGLLEDKNPERQLLLVNSGINNTVIEAQITLYNSLLLQLKGHLEYTSEQNPLIVKQKKELDELRGNILANVNNHIQTIDIQLLALRGYTVENTSKIISNPEQAKYLASIEREQKVKESLYLYLLQKKEENEISVTYKSTNTQVIDVPHGSGKPTSPDRPKVLMAAILLGLMIPVTVLFLRASMDESVRDRFDIERNSDIPFLGEVPFAGKKHSIDQLVLKYLGLDRNKRTNGIDVGYGKQDPSNEAFRIIRTNLEFIANSYISSDHRQGGRVYLIKSTQIGAGKTYVSMNLALTLAIGNKRVLFIDADLRDASASRNWQTPKRGLTDYLAGHETDYSQLLFHLDDYPTLDILPSGMVPSNPTELLRSPLLGQLLSAVRPLYDCIIIDSPSAGMLADAEILGKHADCTLFVIRAGRFNRRNLDELKPIQTEESHRLQYVILNGVSIDSRYGYAYVHKYDRSGMSERSIRSKTKQYLKKCIQFIHPATSTKA